MRQQDQEIDEPDRSLPDISCTRDARGPKIGTCGFGLAMGDYARSFSCVEVQQTFYQPPRLATLARWREVVPADFEFTLKAWQLITHDAKSPTYRRLKRKLSENEKQETGYFRATAIVNEAWEATLASAHTLRAKTILFQCPASFRQTRENVASLEKFFSTINRHDLNLCWEPRGDWDSETVNSICAAFDLSHVVDPFVATTVTPDKCYFRLHGRNGWRYQYGVEELEELATNVSKTKAGYVFFNNRTMTDDALRFCRLLRP
ncbi:MAG TPA: DUF72 domain-containing protein [Pyrinomonadaceae bacterium]|nr:DUF72 domain-containing protein [Pyrinomonadaceae bacterium]